MMTISVPVNSSNKSINAAISCLALDMEGPRRCSSGLIISQEFCQHSSTKLPRRLLLGLAPALSRCTDTMAGPLQSFFLPALPNACVFHLPSSPILNPDPYLLTETNGPQRPLFSLPASNTAPFSCRSCCCVKHAPGHLRMFPSPWPKQFDGCLNLNSCLT